MAFNLNEINHNITTRPQEFIDECDQKYFANVKRSAQKILDNADSNIVLLSGPSGSGKTTTAHNISSELKNMGHTAHIISLDNYFLDVDPDNTPRDQDGNYDFESPLCMDIRLLTTHFDDIARKQTITIPKFDFTKQRRSSTRSTKLDIGENDIVIFEGIHALNPDVCGHGKGKNATKVYISARSNITENGTDVFMGTWTRILRRTIRDKKFRNTAPKITFRMWENLRRGEKKYISPYKYTANIIFDTALPYEVSVLKSFTNGMFDDIDPDIARYSEAMRLKKALEKFKLLSPSMVPNTSLLREFIGGGNYKL